MPAGNVGTIEVRGTKYPVVFSFNAFRGERPSNGTVSMEINGKTINAPTVTALYDAAMRETKRQSVEINVPFMHLTSKTDYRSSDRGLYFRRGTVTKLNVKTDNPVVRWEDGEVDRDFKSGRYGNSENLFPILTPEEQREYLDLKTEEKQIDTALYEFREAHKLGEYGLGKLADKAQEEAVTTAVAAES